MSNPGSFQELGQRLLEEKGEKPHSTSKILALDPGVTTGIAVFDVFNLTYVGQYRTEEIGEAAYYIEDQIHHYEPHAIVIEDYRVYRWKQKQHAWSDLYTPRLIGAIEWLAYDENVPLIKQPAHIAKGFCTDAKLKEWDMWETGMRHGRDAIRHGAYYILFGDREEWSKNAQSKNPHNLQQAKTFTDE